MGEAPEGSRRLARLTLLAGIGDPAAQVELGEWLAASPGQTARRMAHRWLEKAAKSGRLEAQYRLGLMLLSGEGGELDTARAMHWLARAAAEGHADAVRFLASYRVGLARLSGKADSFAVR